MASSSVKTGNYYKRRTRDYYEKLGYTVQLTEFTCALMIKGRCIYRKIDIFGSDGIAMNGKELIFWNSKAVTGPTNSVANEKSRAKVEFEKYPFPPDTILEAVIWEPKKKPQIFRFSPLSPLLE